MAIRRARVEDVKQIYEIIRSNPREVVPRSFPDILTQIDRFYVDIDPEHPFALRGVCSWKVLPEQTDIDNPELWIEVISLSVRAEYQKLGIGSGLVKHMLRKLRALDPDKIICLTFSPPFFEKLGFKEIPKEKILSKIYTGCINCTRYPGPMNCPEVAMEYIWKRRRPRRARFSLPIAS